MPSEMIGEQRSSILWRLVGVIYLVTIHPFVLVVGGIGGIVAMVLDVVYGLLFDKPAGGTLHEWGTRLLYWPINHITWVIVGQPSRFEWTP